MIAYKTLEQKKVNHQILKNEFLNYLPRRLEKALLSGIEDESEMNSLDDLDRIDFHYRRYLAGRCKTLHQVIRSFKRLPRNKYFEGITIMSMIGSIAEVNEFYELLYRHESAKRKLLLMSVKIHQPCLTN